MDSHERKKKSDKAKKTYERNPFSQKHVRLREALAEKRAKKPKG
jgi:hypothetical protein